jgi:hypothetical protein
MFVLSILLQDAFFTNDPIRSILRRIVKSASNYPAIGTPWPYINDHRIFLQQFPVSDEAQLDSETVATIVRGRAVGQQACATHPHPLSNPPRSRTPYNHHDMTYMSQPATTSRHI